MWGTGDTNRSRKNRAIPYKSGTKKNQFLHPPLQVFLKFTPLINIPEARRNANFQPQNRIPSKIMAFYILGQNTHISHIYRFS